MDIVTLSQAAATLIAAAFAIAIWPARVVASCCCARPVARAKAKLAAAVQDGAEVVDSLRHQTRWAALRALQLASVAGWYAVQLAAVFAIAATLSVAFVVALYWSVVPVTELRFVAPFALVRRDGSGSSGVAQAPGAPCDGSRTEPAPLHPPPQSLDGVLAAAAAKYLLDEPRGGSRCPALSRQRQAGRADVSSEAVVDVLGPTAPPLPSSWRGWARWPIGGDAGGGLLAASRGLLRWAGAGWLWAPRPAWPRGAASDAWSAGGWGGDGSVFEGADAVAGGPSAWTLASGRSSGGSGGSDAGARARPRHPMLAAGTAYAVSVGFNVPDTARNRAILLAAARYAADAADGADGAGAACGAAGGGGPACVTDGSWRWGEAALLEVELLASVESSPAAAAVAATQGGGWTSWLRRRPAHSSPPFTATPPATPFAPLSTERVSAAAASGYKAADVDGGETNVDDPEPHLPFRTSESPDSEPVPPNPATADASGVATAAVVVDAVSGATLVVDGTSTPSATVSGATLVVDGTSTSSATLIVIPALAAASPPAVDSTTAPAEVDTAGPAPHAPSLLSTPQLQPHGGASRPDAGGPGAPRVLARCRRPVLVASAPAAATAARDWTAAAAAGHARAGGRPPRGVVRALADALVAAGAALAGSDVVLTAGSPFQSHGGVASGERAAGGNDEGGGWRRRDDRARLIDDDEAGGGRGAPLPPLARLTADCFGDGGWSEDAAAPLAAIRLRLRHPSPSDAGAWSTQGAPSADGIGGSGGGSGGGGSGAPAPPPLTLLGAEVVLTARLTGVAAALHVAPLVLGAALTTVLTWMLAAAAAAACVAARVRLGAGVGFGVPPPRALARPAFGFRRRGEAEAEAEIGGDAAARRGGGDTGRDMRRRSNSSGSGDGGDWERSALWAGDSGDSPRVSPSAWLLRRAFGVDGGGTRSAVVDVSVRRGAQPRDAASAPAADGAGARSAAGGRGARVPSSAAPVGAAAAMRSGRAASGAGDDTAAWESALALSPRAAVGPLTPRPRSPAPATVAVTAANSAEVARAALLRQRSGSRGGPPTPAGDYAVVAAIAVAAATAANRPAPLRAGGAQGAVTATGAAADGRRRGLDGDGTLRAPPGRAGVGSAAAPAATEAGSAVPDLPCSPPVTNDESDRPPA